MGKEKKKERKTKKKIIKKEIPMENIDSVIGARYMMGVHMRLQRSDCRDEKINDMTMIKCRQLSE